VGTAIIQGLEGKDIYDLKNRLKCKLYPYKFYPHMGTGERDFSFSASVG